MAVKQMVTGDIPTFIGGRLVPPNTPVTVDTDEIDLDDTKTDDNGKTVKGKRDIGLHPMNDAKERVARKPVAMAAIGPSGPNPTAPQQLPPGAMQTLDGYTDAEGTPLVAEGSEAELQAEEGGTSRSRKKANDALS